MYSSALKTHLVDAVRDQANKRVEFRLDKVDAVYSSNIRLAGVGINDGKGLYNAVVGSYGIIKNIQILDGNKVLDEIRNFSDYLAFANTNKSNDVNAFKSHQLARNDLGFTYGYDTSGNNYMMGLQDRVGINGDPGGLFSLRSYMNLLKSTNVLPTQLFKNLRIVIDYAPIANVSSDYNATAKTLEPLMIIDELMDEEQAKQAVAAMSVVSWDAIEHDRVSVGDITANEKKTFVINGFDGGKYVKRMLVQRKPVTDVNTTIRKSASSAFKNLKEQFVVNGSNKLPRRGLEDDNERLALLVDTFGEMNVIPGGNVTDAPNHANTHVTTTSSLISSQCWTGLVIGDRVNEIQYMMERDLHTGAGNKANEPHDINFFGEVGKTMVVKGGDYEIVYA